MDSHNTLSSQVTAHVHGSTKDFQTLIAELKHSKSVLQSPCVAYFVSVLPGEYPLNQRFVYFEIDPNLFTPKRMCFNFNEGPEQQPFLVTIDSQTASITQKLIMALSQDECVHRAGDVALFILHRFENRKSLLRNFKQFNGVVSEFQQLLQVTAKQLLNYNQNSSESITLLQNEEEAVSMIKATSGDSKDIIAAVQDNTSNKITSFILRRDQNTHAKVIRLFPNNKELETLQAQLLGTANVVALNLDGSIVYNVLFQQFLHSLDKLSPLLVTSFVESFALSHVDLEEQVLENWVANLSKHYPINNNNSITQQPLIQIQVPSAKPSEVIKTNSLSVSLHIPSSNEEPKKLLKSSGSRSSLHKEIVSAEANVSLGSSEFIEFIEREVKQKKKVHLYTINDFKHLKLNCGILELGVTNDLASDFKLRQYFNSEQEEQSKLTWLNLNKQLFGFIAYVNHQFIAAAFDEASVKHLMKICGTGIGIAIKKPVLIQPFLLGVELMYFIEKNTFAPGKIHSYGEAKRDVLVKQFVKEHVMC